MVDDRNILTTSVIQPYFIDYTLIDWHLISKATTYYSSAGYTQVETPWIIPMEYMTGTKPHNNQTFTLTNGLFSEQSNELVGSAEQGFVYLLANNLLLAGRYFSVTPCFRYEQYDSTHQPWFMKVELFIYLDDTSTLEYELSNMINLCKTFFDSISNTNSKIAKFESSYDLELNDVEIGSYGIRDTSYGKFVYGTGLALPRFTECKV